MSKGSLKLVDIDRQIATQSDIIGWQQSLRAACYEGISATDVKDIVQRQVAKAKDGDAAALQFVMKYVLGADVPVKITQNNIITDVETAARMAKNQRAG